MALTYTALASVTVGSGGASTIEFANIPQTYTDLLVKISARSTGTGGAADRYGTFRFNDSTTNRSYRRLYGYAGVAGSDTGTFGYAFAMSGTGGTASTFCNSELYIPNYAGSNNKSISHDAASEQNDTTNYQVDITASLWSNTAAITNLKFVPDTANFAQYSTFTLYGIKNTV